MERRRQRNGTNRTDGTHGPRIIPPHGGYHNLKSYQVAEIVFDATNAFCDRFVNPRSRTYDQMVQAARSGKQNIAEASQTSGTSKKSELRLVDVARASLQELLEDYLQRLSATSQAADLAEESSAGRDHTQSGV